MNALMPVAEHRLSFLAEVSNRSGQLVSQRYQRLRSVLILASISIIWDRSAYWLNRLAVSMSDPCADDSGTAPEAA
jgi:hypothetical protein